MSTSMNMTNLFLDRAEFSASNPALVLIKKNGERIMQDWTNYARTALKIAGYLNASNIGKGDFVAIIPLNLPASFITMWGVILAGAVPVPINPYLVKEPGLIDVRKILGDCQPKLMLVNRPLSGYLGEIEHQTIEIFIYKAFGFGSGCYSNSLCRCRDNNNTLIMPYTSGTSGDPKGVILTHRNIFDRVEAINKALAVSEQERILSYLPLGHISELIATFFGQLYRGYTVFFTEHAPDIIIDKEKFRNNFQSVLQSVSPTIFLAVPKIWTNLRTQVQIGLAKAPAPYRLIPTAIKRRLVKKRLGFKDTRIFISAGSKLDSTDKIFFHEVLGIDILDIYGITETAGPLLLNGTAIDSMTRLRVLENEEIIVGGNCVMTGYYQRPEINRQSFVEHNFGKYFHTGDAGIISNGKLHVTGRIDDEEKHPNGEKINTAKREAIEKEIKDIDPRIVEVITTIVNRPHITAYVFLSDVNSEENDLHKKIKSRLAQIGEGIYRPGSFAMLNINELELTPTFKVKRKRMLEKLKNVPTTKMGN